MPFFHHTQQPQPLLALISLLILCLLVKDSVAGSVLECTEDEASVCVPNSFCVAVNGNVSCLCSPGFDGDGLINCGDVNECRKDALICAQAALCTNTVGSYECQCPPEYVPEPDAYSKCKYRGYQFLWIPGTVLAGSLVLAAFIHLILRNIVDTCMEGNKVGQSATAVVTPPPLTTSTPGVVTPQDEILEAMRARKASTANEIIEEPPSPISME